MYMMEMYPTLPRNITKEKTIQRNLTRLTMFLKLRRNKSENTFFPKVRYTEKLK